MGTDRREIARDITVGTDRRVVDTTAEETDRRAVDTTAEEIDRRAMDLTVEAREADVTDAAARTDVAESDVR